MTASVRAIQFSVGNPSGLYGGRLAIALESNETFTMTYAWNEQLDRWSGTLVSGTFERLCSLLAEIDLGAVAPLSQAQVRTEVSEIGELVGTEWRRARFTDDNSRFEALTGLIYAIVSQVDAKHAQPAPDASRLVLSVVRS